MSPSLGVIDAHKARRINQPGDTHAHGDHVGVLGAAVWVRTPAGRCFEVHEDTDLCRRLLFEGGRLVEAPT